MIIPMVTERNNGYEKSYDIYSLLLKNRIIFLNSEINSETAGLVVAQLLYLDSEDKNKDIYLYINSPGGSVHDGLQIFDTMKFIKPRVVTIGMGTCASMGAFLLAAGDKRYALPNTNIMIHQPLLSGGIHGQATDIKIIADEIIRTKNLLNKYLSEFTKQPLEVIERDVERDKYFTAEEALKYGLIDEILIPTKK